MTETPAPPPASAPRQPLRLPRGARGWIAGAGLALLLVLAELAWPVHAYFARFELFLFHALLAAAASAALIAATRIAERILDRGDRDDG